MIFSIFCLVYLGSDSWVTYAQVPASECINYDPETTTINVMCGTFNLGRISQDLGNPNLLSSNKKEWILSANLTIGDTATVFITSTDSDWLKIKGDSKNEYYGIKNYGNLIIDHTKISSWNLETDNYVQQTDDGSIKRPYIAIMEDATGQMNITNSEISHLGWDESHAQGVGYYSGDHSKIDNNNIHDLYYGVYSKGVGNIIITNNDIHHNFKYGLYSQTGSYDLLIKNNKVHDTKGFAIVCSLDCSRIIIENNAVYNNSKGGIAFSRNVSDSIARNNTIYDEELAISLSDSNKNQIYGNIISDSKIGVALKVQRPLEYTTSSNAIYENTISNSDLGISIDPEASGNTIHNNAISNSTDAGIFISDFINRNNSIYGNSFSNNNDEISTKSLRDVIPIGLRDMAPSWCKNEINESGFMEGLQYLASRGIISESGNQSDAPSTKLVPEWAKNNACWWSKKLISDRDFVSGIQYLVNKGIIVISTESDTE